MPSKAEIKVRELLVNNGRNAANNREGIRVGSHLHLCELLLCDLEQARADLRKLAVHRTVEETHAGPVWGGGMTCRVCRGEWKKDTPETHAATCPLAAVVG